MNNSLIPWCPVYCISNSKLYLTATDFNNYGAELWVTNGTVSGTKMLKDINPSYSSFPNHLTDINGTLYFTADDGLNGHELWSSDGTAKNTKMVKDISVGYSSDLRNFCSVGDKLYFINSGIYPPALWSSDGTQANTRQVADPVLDNLLAIKSLTPSGNKLFLGGYTDQYGTELYEGDVSAGTLAFHRVGDSDIATEKVNTASGASVYPNPAHGSASLQIKGTGKNTSVTIMDISGRVKWQGSLSNSTKINLPVEKLTIGIYTVTVKSGSDVQVIKLVKNKSI
jgi:ELWxxDGT repeat protein